MFLTQKIKKKKLISGLKEYEMFLRIQNKKMDDFDLIILLLYFLELKIVFILIINILI